jgi:hypothetical protein
MVSWDGELGWWVETVVAETRDEAGRTITRHEEQGQTVKGKNKALECRSGDEQSPRQPKLTQFRG